MADFERYRCVWDILEKSGAATGDTSVAARTYFNSVLDRVSPVTPQEIFTQSVVRELYALNPEAFATYIAAAGLWLWLFIPMGAEKILLGEGDVSTVQAPMQAVKQKWGDSADGLPHRDRQDRPQREDRRDNRPIDERYRGPPPRTDRPIDERYRGPPPRTDRPIDERYRGPPPRTDRPIDERYRGDRPRDDRRREERPHRDDRPRRDDRQPRDNRYPQDERPAPVRTGKVGKHAGNPDRNKDKYNKRKPDAPKRGLAPLSADMIDEISHAVVNTDSLSAPTCDKNESSAPISE